MELSVRKFGVLLKKYFNVRGDLESKQATKVEIIKGVYFRGSKLWILIFAIFLACLGLNVNSTAVIIGAMLISPLMGPIVGMGFAVGIRDFDLFKRSLRNYLTATIISVITATIYFFASPLSQAQSELLSRTSPTLYDVLIALFGGMAGFMALRTKDKGNVIPGVAIATALMPPLCTAGFGLATGNIMYFLGAFYLFFINTVFIALATFFGTRIMKFEQKEIANVGVRKKVSRYILAIVVVTMIPSFFMTVNIIKKSVFESNVNNFINKEIKQSGTQILTYNLLKKENVLRVVAVGSEIADSSIERARSNMGFYKLKKYKLQVIQGTNSRNISLLKDEMQTQNIKEIGYSKIIEADNKNIDKLNKELDEYRKYESLSLEIRDEFRILFPKIKTVSIANITEVEVFAERMSYEPLVLVTCQYGQFLSEEERNKLYQWLCKRINSDKIKLIVE